MPRPKMEYDARLEDVVRRHVTRLIEALTEVVRKGVAAEARKLARAGGAGGRARPKRILPCIAPGCNNASKGPRFHYLCEEHRHASKKEYEAWRQATRARATQAAKPARPAGRAAAAKTAERPKARRIVTCIAPGCSRPSKGPRFHYLCDEHRGAPKRDYEAWRKGAQG